MEHSLKTSLALFVIFVLIHLQIVICGTEFCSSKQSKHPTELYGRSGIAGPENDRTG